MLPSLAFPERTGHLDLLANLLGRLLQEWQLVQLLLRGRFGGGALGRHAVQRAAKEVTVATIPVRLWVVWRSTAGGLA